MNATSALNSLAPQLTARAHLPQAAKLSPQTSNRSTDILNRLTTDAAKPVRQVPSDQRVPRVLASQAAQV